VTRQDAATTEHIADARPRTPAVLLMGPTASGKTDLAVTLVQRGWCEIISVDSAMVYRGMDIGTAKPDAATLARAPHRLIDVVDPADAYSAGRFVADALREMDQIRDAGRVPLLVGGTMLYFRALQQGLAALPDADPQLRAELDARARTEGWPAMHQQLAHVDPDAAARIHPNDAQRIQRALEVFRLTGSPLSRLQAATRSPAARYRFVKLAAMPGDRATLHARIERRLDKMLEAGFLDEVRRLRARGDLHPGLPALRAVGYRQLWQHLAGETDLDTARTDAVRATRSLAKRQLTWLRAETGIRWLDSTSPSGYTVLSEQVESELAGERL
jgi:tRNA dimethylallyltransferase